MVGKAKTISCHVALLDSTPFETTVEKSSRGAVLLHAICKELNLMETDYFGLTFTDAAGIKYWLNMEKRIRKQLGKRPLNFKLEMKFFPPEPAQLQEDITRYQLCLQIREDIISGKLQCSAITLALLGSYTVQAELGDYDSREHGNSAEYVRNFLFSQAESAEVHDKTAELHRQHQGQTPAETEYRFLEIAKKLPMYGVHLYDATDSEGVALHIGISADGIHVYRDTLRINRFVWPKVLHVSYKKKLFYIKVRPAKFEQFESTIGFKTASHALAKRLWKEAVDHHTFFRRKERQVEAGTFGTLLKLGSRYRYSGRTQAQSKVKAATIERPQPLFERTASRISSRNRKQKQPPHIPIAGGPVNDSLTRADLSEPVTYLDDPEPEHRPYSIRSAKPGMYDEPPSAAAELDLDPVPGPPAASRAALPSRGGEGRVYDHVPVEARHFEQPAYDHVPVEEADLDLPSVPTHDPAGKLATPRLAGAVSVDI